MTQFDTAKELLRLASILDSKAATSEAIASEAGKLKQIPEWEKHFKLAKSARHFAAVCREGHDKLKPKREKSDHIVPTWEMVWDYARVKHPTWPMSDVQSWFNYFESVGWVIGKAKVPMRDWHAAAGNGYRRFAKENPTRANAGHSNSVGVRKDGDPDGWAEFLKDVVKRPYKAYRFELEFLRTQFHKWLKDK
jgi:hypothetical protein